MRPKQPKTDFRRRDGFNPMMKFHKFAPKCSVNLRNWEESGRRDKTQRELMILKKVPKMRAEIKSSIEKLQI